MLLFQGTMERSCRRLLAEMRFWSRPSHILHSFLPFSLLATDKFRLCASLAFLGPRRVLRKCCSI